MSKQPDKELYDFIDTLKIHNKDLDVCFNDAVAAGHLKDLFTKAQLQLVDELMERFNTEVATFETHSGQLFLDANQITSVLQQYKANLSGKGE